MSAAAGMRVVASDGQRYLLGELLKSGGAGSVFRVRETPALVAKIYHESAERAVYERKVQAMLSLMPELPDLLEGGRRYVQIAWPSALLRDERGRFLGFVMPAVDIDATSEVECVMQEKQARSLGLPTGLGAKVTLAANLAAVIAELHKRNHRVVDLKPVNLRFYPASLYTAMLDCDGFSIQGEGERFPAPQFTVDYLAPEFQATGLNTPGEQQQDRFALAVIVFQLLNFGIHPFSGRPANDRVPTDIPGRIAGRFYPYGLQPNAQIQPNPASGHEAMPADLRQLFDRAFSGPGAARPSPLEWAALLRGYAQRASMRLSGCARDGTHQHFSGLPCAACARAALIAGVAQRAGQATGRPAAAPARSPAAPAAPPPYVPYAYARGRFGRTAPPPPPPPPPPQARPVRGFASPGAAANLPGAPNVVIPIYRPRTTPYSYPRSSSSSPTFKGCMTIFAFGLGAFVLLLFVLSSVTPQRRDESSDTRPTTYVWGPDAAQEEAQPPPPPAPPVDASASWELQPLSALTGSGRSPMWTSLADARRTVVNIAQASAMQDVTSRREAESWLAVLASRHPKTGHPAANARLRWSDFLNSAPRASVQMRRQSLVDLAEQLRNQPYEAEMTCEWSWLALAEGHRDYAEDAFIQAIWAQPEEMCGWYGLGAVAQEDALRTGALTMVESLRGEAGADSQVLGEFTRQMMSQARLDFERFRVLRARGIRNAMATQGRTAPAHVQALADRKLDPTRR